MPHRSVQCFFRIQNPINLFHHHRTDCTHYTTKASPIIPTQPSSVCYGHILPTNFVFSSTHLNFCRPLEFGGAQSSEVAHFAQYIHTTASTRSVQIHTPSSFCIQYAIKGGTRAAASRSSSLKRGFSQWAPSTQAWTLRNLALAHCDFRSERCYARFCIQKRMQLTTNSVKVFHTYKRYCQRFWSFSENNSKAGIFPLKIKEPHSPPLTTWQTITTTNIPVQIGN